MSTRCQITCEGQAVKVYSHCDGYPSHILPTLAATVGRFIAKRGWEPGDLLAQVVRDFAVKERDEDGGELSVGYWSVETEWHGDLAYVYVVKEDGAIEVRKAHCSDHPDQGEPCLTVPLGGPIPEVDD